MTMVSKIDDESALNRLNGDPTLSVISSGLKTTNGVLEQEGDGAGIGMAFESKCEVRLWTFWIEIDHHLLVHVNTSLG